MHIVLLRGLAREAGHWLDFPHHLRQQLGEHCQLHLVDFPGCGIYFRQTALTSIDAMTDHARAEQGIAEALASGEPVWVIGISMGGMVGLHWAQRFPQEISGIVLINSSAGNQPLHWRLRPSAWPGILLALVSSMESREARVLGVVSNQPAHYPQHLQQWLAIQTQRPISRATIVTMLRAAAGFRPQGDCAVKGLILASTMDRMVDVRASEALGRQFTWPVMHHPSAGHDMPLDDPHWTADNIVEWIRAQS